MNENFAPSRQVRQTVFATLREAVFEGDFDLRSSAFICVLFSEETT
jgi:hypothetical protein